MKLFKLPKANTQISGIKSIKYSSLNIWNNIVNKFPEKELHLKSKTFCKNLMTLQLFETY